MWTSQVYGHHDEMARTKTHRTSQNTEYTRTQQTLRNNVYVFHVPDEKNEGHRKMLNQVILG